MLAAVLGHHHTPVTRRYHPFRNAVELVPENQGQRLVSRHGQFLQGNRVQGLLYSQDTIALLAQLLHGHLGIRRMLPRHGNGRPQGGFLDLPMRR